MLNCSQSVPIIRTEKSMNSHDNPLPNDSFTISDYSDSYESDDKLDIITSASLSSLNKSPNNPSEVHSPKAQLQSAEKTFQSRSFQDQPIMSNFNLEPRLITNDSSKTQEIKHKRHDKSHYKHRPSNAHQSANTNSNSSIFNFNSITSSNDASIYKNISPANDSSTSEQAHMTPPSNSNKSDPKDNTNHSSTSHSPSEIISKIVKTPYSRHLNYSLNTNDTPTFNTNEINPSFNPDDSHPHLTNKIFPLNQNVNHSQSDSTPRNETNTNSQDNSESNESNDKHDVITLLFHSFLNESPDNPNEIHSPKAQHQSAEKVINSQPLQDLSKLSNSNQELSHRTKDHKKSNYKHNPDNDHQSSNTDFKPININSNSWF